VFDPLSDCRQEDRVYELFQILPRVTGEQDVVEVERQLEASCHDWLNTLYLAELPGEV
jgi:hypothetical protein